MRGRPWMAIIGAVAVAACVACTASVPGVAGPDPTVSAPVRPRDIKLQGIDACSVLSAEQRARLGFDTEPSSSISATPLLGPSQDCTILGFRPRAIGLGLALAPETGIDEIRDFGLVAEFTPITVRGYPALIVRRERFSDFCSVDVDIAEGQVVDVLFRDGGRKPPIPQDQLCRDAQTVATEVVASLIAR